MQVIVAFDVVRAPPKSHSWIRARIRAEGTDFHRFRNAIGHKNCQSSSDAHPSPSSDPNPGPSPDPNPNPNPNPTPPTPLTLPPP